MKQYFLRLALVPALGHQLFLSPDSEEAGLLCILNSLCMFGGDVSDNDSYLRFQLPVKGRSGMGGVGLIRDTLDNFGYKRVLSSEFFK